MAAQPEFESTAAPFGEFGVGATAGASPHLSDYWTILSRRLWLILLLFGVTTLSAIWAASRQQVLYRASLSLQVNDPLQRTRALNPGVRSLASDIFVDPLQSEIQVLTSETIAREVAEALGLRLVPVSGKVLFSQLFEESWVAPDAPEGTFELVYDPGGQRVTFRRMGGGDLVSGRVGEELDAGFVRFVPLPPPAEERIYPVRIRSLAEAAAVVRGGLSATPREYTNLLDASFVGDDPVLAPKILVEAAEALRRYGGRRVSTAARKEVAFIEEELARARGLLQKSLEAIQAFKQSQTFTNLSFREQTLVNELQALTQRIQELENHHQIFWNFTSALEGSGLARLDLIEVEAVLPEDASPQIRRLIQEIRTDQAELANLLAQARVTPDHPSAQAVQERIALRERQLLEAFRANLQAVEARLGDARRQEEQLRQTLKSFPQLENELQKLELQREMDQGTYEFLLSQLYQARIVEAAAEPYVDILDRPMGASPVRPRSRVYVLLGAVLGLLLGVGAAFFLEYLDRTVRTSADVENLLGLPVLGLLPRLRPLPGTGGAVDEEMEELPLAVPLDPMDTAAEAYRNLRMNLMFLSTPEQPLRVIQFTSPGPSEGKSTTALNFAVLLAQLGPKVLLIDADLRRPQLHRALNVLREPGLSNVLVGDASLKEALRPSVLPNLDFLPAGPFPPNPSELLDSPGLERLMEELRGRYAHIVVDSPPILAVSDASLLASLSDGAVLVLRSGQTEQRAAERAVRQLQRLGVRVLGAVLNEVDGLRSEEGYYLRYYYSYRSSNGNGRRRRSKVRKAISKALPFLS